MPESNDESNTRLEKGKNVAGNFNGNRDATAARWMRRVVRIGSGDETLDPAGLGYDSDLDLRHNPGRWGAESKEQTTDLVLRGACRFVPFK